MSAEPQSRVPAGSAGPPHHLADGPRCVLTFAAKVISFTGPEPSSAFTAAAAALARDAQRAARHLGFEPWEGIVVESAGGVLGLVPGGAGNDRLAAVVLPVYTPVGTAHRAATRYAAETAGA